MLLANPTQHTTTIPPATYTATMPHDQQVRYDPSQRGGGQFIQSTVELHAAIYRFYLMGDFSDAEQNGFGTGTTIVPILLVVVYVLVGIFAIFVDEVLNMLEYFAKETAYQVRYVIIHLFLVLTRGDYRQ